MWILGLKGLRRPLLSVLFVPKIAISWTHLAEKHALKNYISQKSFEWSKSFSSVFMIIIFNIDHNKIRTHKKFWTWKFSIKHHVPLQKRHENYHNCFSTLLIKWTRRTTEKLKKKPIGMKKILLKMIIFQKAF